MKARLVFFGTPDFSVPTLETLLDMKDEVEVLAVVTQPDRPAGRNNRLTPSPIKKVAEKANIKVIQPDNLKREKSEFVRQLEELGQIDLGVVVAFGQILPKVILDYPKAGCLNIHASLLPRWRGAAPIQRAILAGDTMSGVCLMNMDPGLDTGPVYVQQRIEIEATDNAGKLHDKLAQAGASLLRTNLVKIINGELEATEQTESGVTYAEKITPDETQIDWSLGCQELERKIRAFSPFPGSYTFLNDKRLKILSVDSVGPRASNTDIEPGKIYFVDKQTLEICCGDGILSLTEVQLEGKRAMPVDEFLRGVNISQNCILG